VDGDQAVGCEKGREGGDPAISGGVSAGVHGTLMKRTQNPSPVPRNARASASPSLPKPWTLYPSSAQRPLGTRRPIPPTTGGCLNGAS